ncbi:MAG: hypothetical protein JWM11_4836 [Planctomycetaceae bacterium]|nr:hypothetical protein [Planctomycetaceae bacterium]
MPANIATMPAPNRETVDPDDVDQKSVVQGTARTMSELQTDSFTSPDLGVRDEFNYRPIPVLAPITLAIGFCSIVGLVWPELLAVPLAGIVLGFLTFRRIRRSAGEYGGYKLTVAGLFLSLVLFVAGTSLHAYTYATEVPEGYERLDFRWLSQQKPIEEDGRLRIADEAKAFDGQKVFVKGYMYPENQTSGISRFVLCKDTGQCCFGGDPALTDMIAVEFVNDTRATFRQLSLVSVAGTFRAKKVPTKSGQLAAIYSLEAEYFK